MQEFYLEKMESHWLENPWQRLIEGVILGLLYGLTAGVILGIFFGGLGFLVTELANGAIAYSIVEFIGQFIYVLLSGLIIGLAIGSIIGIICGFILLMSINFANIFGGISVLWHFSLRLVLTKTHKMPWNYARFLNYAADRLFLQRVGSSYHFSHDLLRQHFAKKYGN
jgi:hypothetical protein